MSWIDYHYCQCYLHTLRLGCCSAEGSIVGFDIASRCRTRFLPIFLSFGCPFLAKSRNNSLGHDNSPDSIGWWRPHGAIPRHGRVSGLYHRSITIQLDSFRAWNQSTSPVRFEAFASINAMHLKCVRIKMHPGMKRSNQYHCEPWLSIIYRFKSYIDNWFKCVKQ